jgi:hypothetical protein
VTTEASAEEEAGAKPALEKDTDTETRGESPRETTDDGSAEGTTVEHDDDAAQTQASEDENLDQQESNAEADRTGSAGAEGSNDEPKPG